MKVCFVRSRTDPKALAEVMTRQKLTGGTLHNDTDVIPVPQLYSNEVILTAIGLTVQYVCVDASGYAKGKARESQREKKEGVPPT